MKRKFLVSIVLFLFLFSAIIPTFAKGESISEEEMDVIMAEDIGIVTIEEDKEKYVYIENENPCMDDVSENKEISTKKEVHNTNKKEVAVKEQECLEDEIEDEEIIADCPEGMSEGYIAGTFFEPNHFGDCELHEYCYICPECTIVEEIGRDEDINPNGGWYLDRCCIVCGHGTCEAITREEALGE